MTVFGKAKHLTISLSHPGQLSLLPLVAWEMSTQYWPKCHDALELGWLIPCVNKRGWQLKLCDPSLTCANLSALEMSTAYIIKRYTVLFTYLLVVSLRTGKCTKLQK